MMPPLEGLGLQNPGLVDTVEIGRIGNGLLLNYGLDINPIYVSFGLFFVLQSDPIAPLDQ